jgi:eukaryotic-like serine/threonine-protein kinase
VTATVTIRLSVALADRYRIERELGAGGMATVYLAHDLKHDRKVAVKVLKPELAAVLGADRFVIEIKTTAALQHPHILPLFDSGTADGFLYYVMPFIDGETLRAKLDRDTQLGIEESVKIATQVADALDYAHRHGVIHRDIKPENILLHDGRPMVADFGIALAVSAAAGGRMTETGLSLGTPHYMSPEQATAEKEITGRSDIYSLASVLYEMLTGDPPHTGASAQQIIMKIIAEPVQPVTALRKSVPANVAAAVEKALEKLPADRFENAKAFADALANPSFTTATTGVAGSDAPHSLTRGVNRGLVALSALLAVLLVWQAARPATDVGPRTYDVALPDTAPLDRRTSPGFAVAPDGDFVVYATGDRRALWYRSLRDETARLIAGTDDAKLAAISPDGKKVAFVRHGTAENTVEVIPVDGGPAVVIGRSRASNSLQWQVGGRILLTEGDGLRAQSFDPAGGPSTDVAIKYCIDPAPMPDHTLLMCGGGGDMMAEWSSLADSTSRGYFRTTGRDSSLVFGSTFRIVDAKYMVWLSTAGDLLAATVDVATKRVGRPVRMLTGLARGSYSGAGSYALSATGTLVYADGINEAVGHLVRADGRTMDTLRVGREAFLQFAMSPDGRRLAAVVQRLDGQELRLYDLQTGEHTVWIKRATLRQPVWSPGGDRLIGSTPDTVFIGPPDGTSPPQVAFVFKNYFEGFSWRADGRLIGTLWGNNAVVATTLDRKPPSFDTLATFAAMGRLSPDGRWLAYNAADFRALWIEPFPRTGQRYAVSNGDYPQWLSASEFVTSTDAGHFDRITVDASVQPPKISRRPWFDVPRFVSIASGGFVLAPDGRVVYKQGGEIAPIRSLRVVPNWVTQMKRAVDAASR